MTFPIEPSCQHLHEFLRQSLLFNADVTVYLDGLSSRDLYSQAFATRFDFFIGAWDLNLGSGTQYGSTLPTEPIPSPWMVTAYVSVFCVFCQILTTQRLPVRLPRKLVVEVQSWHDWDYTYTPARFLSALEFVQHELYPVGVNTDCQLQGLRSPERQTCVRKFLDWLTEGEDPP